MERVCQLRQRPHGQRHGPDVRHGALRRNLQEHGMNQGTNLTINTEARVEYVSVV